MAKKIMAGAAKKGAKIVTMVAAMRDMGIPVEERAATVVDMWSDFGFIA